MTKQQSPVMTHPGWEVKLCYFKQSGKYYSDGTYITHKQHTWQVFDEVREFRRIGKLPGLCDGGGQDFIIHIYAATHPCAFPGLIIP